MKTFELFGALPQGALPLALISLHTLWACTNRTLPDVPAESGTTAVDKIGEGIDDSACDGLGINLGFCGDGVRCQQAGEYCDDGNVTTETECPYGVSTCVLCNATCTGLLELTGGVCGDGILDPAEFCDDGFSDACGSCNADCTAVGDGASCGDGVLCPETELCDDGFNDPCGSCNTDCRTYGAGSVCGDGAHCPETEACDDGFNDACGGCNADCTGTGVSPVCGNGTFAAAVHYPTAAGGKGPMVMVTGDFDGNGIWDLAASLPSYLSVHLGNGVVQGDGTLADAVPYSAGSRARGAIVGDFNGDGVSDLAIAKSSGDAVGVFIGIGDGTFAPCVDYPTARWPRSITAGDFDADGILDLAVTNQVAQSVSILFGNGSSGQGDGTFAAHFPMALPGRTAWSIDVGDFNGDGIQDLAVSNSSTVSILIGYGSAAGIGAGPFADPVDYPGGGTHGIFITTGDFNTDGITDLAVANANGGDVNILLGNGTAGSGDGTFGAPTNFQTGSRPISITTGEFNGDGITDLAVCNNSSHSVSILLGNGAAGQGDGTFAAPSNYLVGTTPYSVITADFNADGILDLATGNYTSNSISVLIGR